MLTKSDKILYIPIGLPGCGKTYNRKRDAIIISKDSIRFMLLNYEQTNRNYYLDTVDEVIGDIDLENVVDFIMKCAFKKLLTTGYNIYLDGTNLNAKHREYYIREAGLFNYKIHFILYSDDLKAFRRNSKRGRKVPLVVYSKMLLNKDKLTDFEKGIAAKIEVMT